MIGMPLQKEKRVDLGESNDFMGLTHHMSQAISKSEITFTPKHLLVQKAQAALLARIEEKSCTAAQASKLRGILGFTLTGLYGKVGRAGQHALLRRQYWDGPNTGVDAALQQALNFYHDLLAMNLRRCFRLAAPSVRRRVVVASDGRLDESKPASIATLICTGDERLALIADIPQTLQEAWSHRVQFIDLVEQSAVIMALTLCPGLFARSDILWFIDNSVALAGLAKGANGGLEMDKGCAVIHLLLAHLQADAWWEYVESEANWSDGASRTGSLDKWVHDNKFKVVRCEVPQWPWAAEAAERAKRVQEILQEVSVGEM